MTNLLEINNLSVDFPSRRGQVAAVNKVSIAVAKGEVLGLVGESGAGKSTVGNSVINLLEPPGYISGGEIVFDGTRIDQLSNEEMRKIRGARIGTIFQDPQTSLNPLMTIGKQLSETLIETLKISGADKQQVGAIVSKLKTLRKIEPYKGKGVREKGQYILKKEGKKK